MAITDFLFRGTAPPEVSTFSSTTANVPDWWASYVKGTIAKASQIAGEPYQAYTGPRVAGDTADQTAAFDPSVICSLACRAPHGRAVQMVRAHPPRRG